ERAAPARRGEAAMRTTRAAWPLALFAAGCGGRQSALDPAGPQSGRIHALGEVYFWVCVAVFVLTLGAVLAAVVARRLRPGESDAPDTDPPEPAEKRRTRIVWAAVALTTLTLIGLLVGEFLTG